MRADNNYNDDLKFKFPTSHVLKLIFVRATYYAIFGELFWTKSFDTHSFDIRHIPNKHECAANPVNSFSVDVKRNPNQKKSMLKDVEVKKIYITSNQCQKEEMSKEIDVK